MTWLWWFASCKFMLQLWICESCKCLARYGKVNHVSVTKVYYRMWWFGLAYGKRICMFMTLRQWYVASDLLLYGCVVNCVLMMMMWIWVWFTTWQSDFAGNFAWVVWRGRGMVVYLPLGICSIEVAKWQNPTSMVTLKLTSMHRSNG